jgi:hypothetical protein
LAKSRRTLGDPVIQGVHCTASTNDATDNPLHAASFKQEHQQISEFKGACITASHRRTADAQLSGGALRQQRDEVAADHCQYAREFVVSLPLAPLPDDLRKSLI